MRTCLAVVVALGLTTWTGCVRSRPGELEVTCRNLLGRSAELSVEYVSDAAAKASGDQARPEPTLRQAVGVVADGRSVTTNLKIPAEQLPGELRAVAENVLGPPVRVTAGTTPQVLLTVER